MNPAGRAVGWGPLVPDDPRIKKPNLKDDVDRLVERGTRALALAGGVTFLAGIALAARPKRLWVCESCLAARPRE